MNDQAPDQPAADSMQPPPPPVPGSGYGPVGGPVFGPNALGPVPGPGYGSGGYGSGYGPSGFGPGGPEPKSKLVAGLLGIFLGGLGIHRFYLGYTNMGVIMLLVSLVGGLLTCGLSAAVVSMWGLIEGILYLMGSGGYTHDARGISLRD